MSAWDMNDGSALTGTHTFTNGSAIVNGNASAVYLTEVKVGDVVTSAAGERLRVKDQHPARVIPTSGVNDTTNVITFTAHGYLDGTAITYNAGGGTAMAGLTDGQIVFVRDKADDTFKVAATSGGTAIDITDTGNNAQNFVGLTNTGLTMTTSMAGSTESGVAASVSRPPVDFSSGGTQIDANIFGITSGESLGGVDNVTSINVGTTSLGTYDRIGGNTYHTSAPSVTVAAPTARTITQANIDETTNVFTVTGHNMRTGTKLTYTSNGTNIVHSGGTLADATAVFVIRIDEDTFKIASSLSNANAGTALDITNDGNDSNSFVGDTATATATISGGKVTGITVTAVGSDYQSAPTVTIAAPSGTGNLNLTSSSVLIVADDEIVVPAAFYAAISTGESVTYAQGGSGAQADLTDGTVYYLIKSGTSNRISLATSAANALAGTKIDLTAVASGGTAHSFVGGTAIGTAILGLGVDGDNNSREIAHVGWVKKTVGTGGRAGRVHYETLVAASSISGDAEDIATPDS